MKKQKLRMAFEELERELAIISQAELYKVKGGYDNNSGLTPQSSIEEFANYFRSLGYDLTLDSNNNYYFTREGTYLTEKIANAYYSSGGEWFWDHYSGDESGTGGEGSGNFISWDCVFNVFTYLDGDNFSIEYYQTMTMGNMYYNASENGGVFEDDIPTVGNFGYMSVEQVGTFNLENFDNGTNRTTDGRNFTLLVDGVGGMSHMVVVKSIVTINGQNAVNCYDPTFDEWKVYDTSSIKKMFLVGDVGTFTPPFGSSGSSGYNYSSGSDY